MLHKGPHISIASETLVPRILHISLQEFEGWPKGVQTLTLEIAEELFLVHYNPFVDPVLVKESIREKFEHVRRGLAQNYATALSEGIAMFWTAHEENIAFREELIQRLGELIPKENIDTRAHSRVEMATDATDLRLELPLLVVTPSSAEEISTIIKLANELQFAIVPRGGGSGLTGGAVPARKRSVVMSMCKLCKIESIDRKNKTLHAQAGVITHDAFLAAAKEKLLFSVDPASKTASTLGGNIAENSGGPLCFEYGTAIDNLLSFRMVTPTGEIISVERRQHPRHKIREHEIATFEVRDMSGGVRKIVELTGLELRAPGLGKDVTNKALGGLPGVQKEGVDGVITDAVFILHEQMEHARVMVLEFYGRSMHNAVLVIGQIVDLRDQIRVHGADLIKITALEEFNSKYVTAIEYAKKSTQYEGEPISVLILQLDSNDADALDATVQTIVEICLPYDEVDAFVARDKKEAEVFWEDRHNLSAIARRTSGFKINEDVVIPLAKVPEFALFLEDLNVKCMAAAYRRALQEIGRLSGFPPEDKEFNRQFSYATRLMQGEKSTDISDQELQLHAALYLQNLIESYPTLTKGIENSRINMLHTRIEIANHMHAGDGNCHVNIPVNSNDHDMVHRAEKIAAQVMTKAQELGGAVTGEHGIGITKIGFLSQEKMDAIRTFKEQVDPLNILNPAKLTQRELPVASFTFSFNSLIQDIKHSGLPDKDRLINLLGKVQVCTRCGKCKQVCPMFYPSQGLLYYPRNKNLALGALIEAIYYSQVAVGKPDHRLLAELRRIIEHCTACGKCMTVCPVKISSAEVTLALRAFLDEEGASGHNIKKSVLGWAAAAPATRVPLGAKTAAVGQKVQNQFVSLLPRSIRERFQSPLFSGLGPEIGFRNLQEAIHLDKGSIFVPAQQQEAGDAVLYFPGCGGALFNRAVGLAGIGLLLQAGVTVIVPDKHLCCGYALLAAGSDSAFAENLELNVKGLLEICQKAVDKGFTLSHAVTACGSCRDGLERHILPERFKHVFGMQIVQMDIVQFLLSKNSGGIAHNPVVQNKVSRDVIYHAPCHSEWVGVHKVKAATMYAEGLEQLGAGKVTISPGCCGESGLGAISSPGIYNQLRARKKEHLLDELKQQDMHKAVGDKVTPVIVGCPSCKIGISRILLNAGDRRTVYHSLEWLALLTVGEQWEAYFKQQLKTAPNIDGIRKLKNPL